MKVCTKCNRTYTDESLAYCLECGSQLKSGSLSSSTQSAQTLVMNNPTEIMQPNHPTHTVQSNPTLPHYKQPTNVSAQNPSNQPQSLSQHPSYPLPVSESSTTQKPSAAGRISAILCILITIASTVLFIFVLIGIALEFKDETALAVLGFTILLSLFLPGVGTIFGLFGLYLAFRAGKGQGAKKTAIIGILLNLVLILGLLLLFVLGTIEMMTDKA